MPAKPLKIPAALLARYQAGELSIFRLARPLDVSASRVWRELRRLGIDTSRGTRLPSVVARRRGFADAAAMEAAVCELYARGRSLAQVAREVGVSVEAVRQILLRRGVKVRRQDHNT
jgi:predicted HTH domain antitoxin